MAPPDSTLIRLREAWLEAMVRLLNDHMQKCGVATADNCRVSCGFPLARGRSQAERINGQCFSPVLSRDGRAQIYITPLIDNPVKVSAVLLHELIHAGGKPGHRREFSCAARKVGLLKPWVSTQISDDLLPLLEHYVKVLGPYPHAAILRSSQQNHLTGGDIGSKAQISSGSRLRLFECNCIPVIKARVAHDDFPAICEVCRARFHRVA